MDNNGGDDFLKEPLIQHSDTVIVTVYQPYKDEVKKTRTIMFKIGNVKCVSCVTSIESALGMVNGIKSVMVSVLQGQAVIKYAPDLINVKSIKEAIENLGFQLFEFPERDVAVCRLRVKGMTCTSCSESIESALLMVDGAKTAVVGLSLEEAKVHFDLTLTDSDELIQAIVDAGFEADLITTGTDGNKVHLCPEGISSNEDLTIIQSSFESVQGVNHVEINVVNIEFRFV